MRTYDTYKDSGISWLGQIPSHWKVYPMKRLFSYGKGLSITKADLSETGNPVISYGQIHSKQNTGTRTDDNLLRYVPETYTDGHRNSAVYIGDFIFADTSEDFAGCGNCVYIDKNGIYAGYHTLIARGEGRNNQYFSYLFLSDLWRYQIRSRVNGIKVYSITKSILSSTLLTVPPLAEQEAIVAFLNDATARIDCAIEQQKKMIDLLRERKQVIINEAVTRGLNPDVPMQATNIDWLPQIPAHWQLHRFGALGTFSKGSGIARDDLQDEGLPAILYGDIYTKYDISVQNLKNRISAKTAQNAVKISAGDILLTGSGETKEDIGKTIFYEGEDAYAGGDVIIFRQQSNTGKFLSYLLNSYYARRYKAATSKGEIVVHTYPYILKDLYLPIPPLEEQVAIVEKLDNLCKSIDTAITSCEKKIELLTERKQIVINDVVTGKNKVV